MFTHRFGDNLTLTPPALFKIRMSNTHISNVHLFHTISALVSNLPFAPNTLNTIVLFKLGDLTRFVKQSGNKALM